MNDRPRKFDAIEAQAAAWLVLRDRGLNVDEATELRRWREADPQHAAAFSAIESAWTALDRPAAAGRAEALRAELCALSRRDRRRRIARVAQVGALAAAAALVVAFWPHRPIPPRAAPAGGVAPTARVNAPTRQVLPDGSVVELNHGAEISAAFDARVRRVALLRGNALFLVRKDAARPFVVDAHAVEVRAVGTAFAVHLDPGAVEVIVTEGVVRVQPPAANPAPATSLVNFGQHMIVPLAPGAAPAAVAALPAPQMAQRLSWRVPRLDFSEATLAEAVALFNAHNSIQLRLADETTAALKVTGVFRADNLDGFVRALEASLGIRSVRRADEIVLQRAP